MFEGKMQFLAILFPRERRGGSPRGVHLEEGLSKDGEKCSGGHDTVLEGHALGERDSGGSPSGEHK